MGLSTKDLQPSTHYVGVKKMHVISTAVTGRKAAYELYEHEG